MDVRHCLSKIALILAFLIAGCQRKPAEMNRSIHINLGQEPDTIDVRKARKLDSVIVCKMLYEGLTRISKARDVEPALAEQIWVSDDGLIYRFYLKKTFWSNGEPVTANDFLAAWTAILDPQFPSDIAYQLYPIKNASDVKNGLKPQEALGISAPDLQTLVVQLKEPTPYFLDLCATPAYFPVPSNTVKQNNNWAASAETFVGNGPFILTQWSHNDHLTVEKNAIYWDAEQVHLDQIELVIVTPDTEIRLFEDKKLDWAGSPLSVIPPDAILELKKEQILKTNPLSGTFFFRLNTQQMIQGKCNILAYKEFRRALGLAIDRELITTHLLQGDQLPARRFVPPDMHLSQKDYFLDDLDQAGKLLTAALDSFMTKSATVVVSFSNTERNFAIAQAVQKQWERLPNLNIELEPLENKVFLDRIKSGNFQIAAGSWIADFDDPINFLEVFKYKAASVNNTFWENAKYVELLNQSALCRSFDERRELMRQAEEILMDEMPMIPIFHFATNYLQSDRLKNVFLSSIGQIDFRWAEINPE